MAPEQCHAFHQRCCSCGVSRRHKTQQPAQNFVEPKGAPSNVAADVQPLSVCPSRCRGALADAGVTSGFKRGIAASMSSRP